MKKYYVIRFVNEGQDCSLVFTKKSDAKAKVDEDFNKYDRLGADLIECDADELNSLLQSGTKAEFY